jgi:mRNA-degrading endonuclease YafQ of YafQ-DinJ toxin-antitoxin module
MREPKRPGQFKKDYKLMEKRRKDMSKIDEAIVILINGRD